MSDLHGTPPRGPTSRLPHWSRLRPTVGATVKGQVAKAVLTAPPSLGSATPMVVRVAAPCRPAAGKGPPPSRPEKNPAREAARRDAAFFHQQATQTLRTARGPGSNTAAAASGDLIEFSQAQLTRKAQQLTRLLARAPADAPLASLTATVTPPGDDATAMGCRSTPQPGWKFSPDERLHARLRLPSTVQVRAAFHDFGFCYLSNAVAAGGFGKMHVAINLNGQLMAVKVMHIDGLDFLARDPTKPTLTRPLPYEIILREADALSSLSEHIDVFGSMRWKNKYLLFMTLMQSDALSLFRRIDAASLSSSVRLAYADSLRQLARLHENSRIHSDLKWENVLVDKQGTFCLADFSFVKQLDARGECWSSTLQGSIVPPEMCDRGSRAGYLYTAATDVFALGASLGDALAPQAQNPFFATQLPGGRTGWASADATPSAYAHWYASIQRGDGTIDIHRVRPQGVFGRYFTHLRRYDAALCQWALQYLCHPEAQQRASASDALAALERLPGRIDPYLARSAVAMVPPPARQAEAESALRAVHRHETGKVGSRQPFSPVSYKFW